MQSERTSVWIDGIERHLEDLKENAYEGASGADRHALYVAAFELLTPSRSMFCNRSMLPFCARQASSR